MADSKPKVTGIGGIFFRTKDPKELMAWYGDNLGLALNGYARHLNSGTPIDQTRSTTSSGAPLMKRQTTSIRQKKSL
jgi:hypothetical protein